MKIKVLNPEYSTVQNFLYAVLVLTWRHVSNRIKDICGQNDIEAEYLVEGTKYICDCEEIISGIAAITEGTIQMNSLRTYMTRVKSDVRDEEIRRVFLDFVKYLVNTSNLSDTQALRILQALYGLISSSTLEEYSNVKFARNTFSLINDVRLRKK